MQAFSIWVDADSCQSKARNSLQEIALKYSVPVILVANRAIPFFCNSPLFNMVIREAKKDAADTYISVNCTLHDIVVTRDLPLAQKLLQKGITVINDRGIIFTKTTLEKMLKERELSMQMAALGIRNGKFSTYSNEDLKKFTKNFQQALQNNLQNAKTDSNLSPC